MNDTVYDIQRPKLAKHYFHRIQRYVNPFEAVPSVIGTKGRAYGIDISHWVGSFHYNLSEPNLIDFAIQKATEGIGWKDPAFEELWRTGVSQVSVKGAYHYLRSQWSGVDQAKYFLDTIAGKDYQVIAIDFEGYGNDMGENFVRILYDCLRYVTDHSSYKVLLYTNPNFYDNYIHPISMKIWGRDVFLEWKLWIAQYYWIVDPDGQPNIKTRNDWWMWQISDAGDPTQHGTGGYVDRNVVNGTVQDLFNWAEVVIVDPPPGNGEEPVAIHHVGRMTRFTNIRSSAPGGSYQDIGDLLENDVVHADEIILSGVNEIPWWRIVYWERNGVEQALPSSPTGECWAYGVNIEKTGEIVIGDPTDPPAGEKPVIHYRRVETWSAPGYPDHEVITEFDWSPDGS